MNIAPQKPWTQERLFEWAQAQDIRYEFDGIQPMASAGISSSNLPLPVSP